MSIEALCDVHGVSVLEERIIQGPAMGSKRTWADAGKALRCRLIPLSTREQLTLLKDETRILYRVRFASNPVLDARKHRLLVIDHPSIQGHVLRLIATPYDAHGLARMWTCLAEEHSEDQLA